MSPSRRTENSTATSIAISPPPRLGQIAGRAGRHLRDGTFGVTGQVDPLDDELVQEIEAHEFDPVKVLQWRTAEFDFASLDALKRSIETPAPVEGLTRALPAVDVQALDQLSRDPEIRDLATGRERVALAVGSLRAARLPPDRAGAACRPDRLDLSRPRRARSCR